MRYLFSLFVFALSASSLFAQTKDEQHTQDVKLLETKKVPTEGKALIGYLKGFIFKEAPKEQIEPLVAKMGHEHFVIREKAYQGLLDMGPVALSGLKLADQNPDPEVRRRVRELLEKIESKALPSDVQSAVGRVLGREQPEGAAAILLAYLPFADSLAINDLCLALSQVAQSNGKIDPAIALGLKDQHPLKRGAAGEAVLRAGLKDQQASARQLLKDENPLVRLRVALTMAQQKEKDAVPVLVDLMADLNADHMVEAEELLVRLANPTPPSVSLGTSDTTRKAARDAWHGWLTKNEKELDKLLVKLDEKEAFLGYTLIVQQRVNRPGVVNAGPFGGEVFELDNGNKPRWKIQVDRYPVDGQMAGRDRVLIAEYQGGRVTERSIVDGSIKWEKAVGGNPIGVQRLPNGNTFVVMQNRLVEYDRAGNEVFTFNRNIHDIFRARKLPAKNELVFITNQGQLTRMDAKSQKVLKTFHVSPIPILFGNIDLLPDGGVLIPDFQQNRVVEYGPEGNQKKVFSGIQTPNSATRLPNGHTLVASQNTRQVVQFDEKGDRVWNFTTDGMVFNARKR